MKSWRFSGGTFWEIAFWRPLREATLFRRNHPPENHPLQRLVTASGIFRDLPRNHPTPEFEKVENRRLNTRRHRKKRRIPNEIDETTPSYSKKSSTGSSRHDHLTGRDDHATEPANQTTSQRLRNNPRMRVSSVSSGWNAVAKPDTGQPCSQTNRTSDQRRRLRNQAMCQRLRNNS